MITVIREQFQNIAFYKPTLRAERRQLSRTTPERRAAFQTALVKSFRGGANASVRLRRDGFGSESVGVVA